jgi:protein-export membrane protein SecD
MSTGFLPLSGTGMTTKKMTSRKKLKIKFFAIIILAIVAGLVSYPQAVKKVPRVYDFFNKAKINLGLDLQGGIHLEYKADTSQLDSSKVGPALQALQDVISRRVNAFGVAEPVIYTQKSGSENRLVVELAGVKDINQAKELIQGTPFLEFKEVGEPDQSQQIPQDILDQLDNQAQQKAKDVLKKALAGEDFAQLAKDNSEDQGSKDKGGDLDFVKKGMFVPEFDKVLFDPNFKDGTVWPELVESQFGWHIIKKIEQRGDGDNLEVRGAHILIAKKINPKPQSTYASTGLTGKNLKNALVEFRNQGLSEPEVGLQFDTEGTKLFADITKRNIGKPLAIFLDGQLIEAPTVQTEISNGQAVITGNFTVDQANKIVKNLNEGALPVPITLVGQQSVEASLGQVSLQKSLYAGLIGLICVIVFMIIYYRFLGLIAALALIIYSVIMISVFKLSAFSPWQITLTLPGIAGFILSIGMAVDANILIFERTKEEIRKGRTILGAIEEGFKRAWTSIRDGNVSSIITAFILIIMGTGFVKGFAITLIIGVLISMFTAVVITRTILIFLMGEWIEDRLYLIGVKREDKNF